VRSLCARARVCVCVCVCVCGVACMEGRLGMTPLPVKLLTEYICGVTHVVSYRTICVALVSYREGVVCTIQASDGGDVSAGQLHGAAGGRSATPHITVRYAVRTQGAAYRESIQHCEIRRAHAGGSVQGEYTALRDTPCARRGQRTGRVYSTARYAVRTQGVQGGWVGRIFNGASYREGRACIHTRVCKMGGRACV
jgi:hypothetical protein